MKKKQKDPPAGGDRDANNRPTTVVDVCIVSFIHPLMGWFRFVVTAVNDPSENSVKL